MSIRLPELRRIRHIVVTAETGSITGAAGMLGITQSALTRSIAEVEHLLGTTLFERLPRGVRLTATGEAFVVRAGRLLNDAGELMQELEEISDLRRGQLKIGVAPAGFVGFLEHAVSAFAKIYPGIRIEIQNGTVDEMASAVINGNLDLCVGSANYLEIWKELNITSLREFSHFFIGRKDHPANRSGVPTATQLLQYPVILPTAGLSTEAALANAYNAADLSPVAPQYICDHFPLVAKLVNATDAISPVLTLNRRLTRLHHDFCIFENIIELPTHSLAVASSSRDDTRAVSAFVDIFRSLQRDDELLIA